MILAWLVMGLLILGLGLVAVVMIVHGYFMLRNRVPYVVLPDGAMEQVIRALGVRPADTVLDLGCGDGRVLMALRVQCPDARYLGVENDLVVWLRGKWLTRGRVQLRRGEIGATPLGEATRVFCYLGPKMMAELEPRFERELRPGARVVSVQFPLPHRPPVATVELPASKRHAGRLFVYEY